MRNILWHFVTKLTQLKVLEACQFHLLLLPSLFKAQKRDSALLDALSTNNCHTFIHFQGCAQHLNYFRCTFWFVNE